MSKSVKQLVEPKKLILRKLIVESVKEHMAPENNSIMTLLMMISESNNHANKHKKPSDYSNSSNYIDKHHYNHQTILMSTSSHQTILTSTSIHRMTNALNHGQAWVKFWGTHLKFRSLKVHNMKFLFDTGTSRNFRM